MAVAGLPLQTGTGSTQRLSAGVINAPVPVVNRGRRDSLHRIVRFPCCAE
ncbi:hypothetical protein [Azospirillum largimobile]